MSTLYITEQGAVLGKVSRRLVVHKGDDKLAEVPAVKIDRVMLFGNIQVTTQAIAFLLDSGIDLCYLTSKGRYRGRLSAAESRNIFLRIAQYERYLDNEFQMAIARSLVEAKIKNAKSLIKNYQKNYPGMDFSEVLAALDRALSSVAMQTQVSSLLGVEGSSTAAYFRSFGRMLRKSDMAFTGRTKHPPGDPINALLSFGYTLVTNEILSFLFAVGLDPYIGFLHSLYYGRPSLALDMAEEFRHPVVDRFTLYLVNNSIISRTDFEDKEEGFFLTPQALKRYFQHYEERMGRQSAGDNVKENPGYRNIIRQQAYKIAKSILTGDTYKPYIMEE